MVRRTGTPRSGTPRRPGRREEVRGNSRLKGDLAAKDEVIAEQGATIEEQGQEITDQQDTIQSLSQRLTQLENTFGNFRDRPAGFATEGHGHALGDLTGKLSGERLDNGSVASEALASGIAGGKIRESTITRREIELSDLYVALDNRYARK